MMSRLGVNINVSEAIAKLAHERIINDPATVRPLIRCLNHPLLDVAESCHEALFDLTGHNYGGWNFFYKESSTEEKRQEMVEEWTDWENNLQSGHLLFDDWLESEVQKTLHELGRKLEAALKNASRPDDYSGGVACGYIDSSLVKNPQVSRSERAFYFSVGDHNAGNWPSGAVVQSVGVEIFRPGTDKQPTRPLPSEGGANGQFSLNPFDTPQRAYSETFPALDLAVQVSIQTRDDRLRNAFFAAATEGLAELRAANREPIAR
jgi:hypothetical protein